MHKKYTSSFFVFLIIASFLFSCGKEQASQAPPILVKTVMVEEKNVPIYKEFVGQLYGIRDVPIRARVDGFLEGLYFKEGSVVKANQLLYKIDPQPLEASLAEKLSQLAQATVKATNAQSDYERYEPLAAINAVSQSELDTKKAAYEASLAAVDASQAAVDLAKIQLSYTQVRSPIKGIIGKTTAKIGEYVGKDPNPIILNYVSKTDTILVQFFISENEYLSLYRNYLETHKERLATGMAQNQSNDKGIIELFLSDGSKFSEVGQFDFLDREVDPNTGSILMQVSFPNPDLILRPGLFGKIRITIAPDDMALVVPARSVMELQGKDFVFVVDKQNQALQKEVTLGEKYKDYYIVKKGLEKGESIVLEGIQKVRDSTMVVPQMVKFESQFKQ